MPRSFPCPGCGGAILTFLRRGETARCGACGAAAVVPEEAVECPPTAGWIPPAPGPGAGPAPPAAPPGPRDGPPPPFLGWSFALSGLLPALFFLGLGSSEHAGYLAGGCALVIAVGYPWLLVFGGIAMAVMVLGPPWEGPGSLSRVLVLVGAAAALAEYPVYALILRRFWRWGDTGRGVARVAALHLLAILLGGFLCVMFFHPV